MLLVVGVLQSFLLTVGFCEHRFWLTAELVRSEWKKGCLTTGGCADPRFRVTETNLATNEQTSISWSILEDFNQQRSRTFVSHWKRGYPTDVTLVCEVVGIDPTYGFPRVCDATANVQLYEKKLAFNNLDSAQIPENFEIGDGKMVVEVKGKCFNASLTVEKHEHRCPWCPQKQEQLAFVAQPDSENKNETDGFLRSGHDIRLLHVALIVLACIALLSTAAFACLLTAFIRQRRCLMSTNKCPVEKFFPSGILMDNTKITDDCRYELPWDQKYRPLPNWPVNRSGITCSLNKCSPSTSGTLIYQTSRIATDEAVHYETPTIIMSDQHNDSGHDSV